MPDYDNTNRGAVFVNDRKDTEKHPDMRGSINVDGVDYWLSCWWKTPQNGGNEFLSLSIQPKEQSSNSAAPRGRPAPPPTPARGRPQAPARQPAPSQSTGSGFKDMDDDIPF